MHHAGQVHVIHIHRLARHLAGNVQARHGLAHDGVGRGRLGLHATGSRLHKAFARHQLPIGDFGPRLRVIDRAVLHAQAFGGRVQFRGGLAHEDVAHLRRGLAHRRPADLGGGAARGVAFIGREQRIRQVDVHARHRHIQLFGCDLGDHRLDALSDLHLAGEDGDGSAWVDADPAVQFRRLAQAGGQGFRRHGFTSWRVCAAIVRPARCTARMMRG